MASVGKAVSQTGLGYGSTRRIENGSSRKLRGGVRLVQLKSIIESLLSDDQDLELILTPTHSHSIPTHTLGLGNLGKMPMSIHRHRH